MSWLDKIKEYAPDIALAVATGGVSAVKSAALRMLAKELTGDPESPVDDIRGIIDGAGTEQLTKLAELNHTFTIEKARLESQNLLVVNETMRTEAGDEKWWVSGWRPFIGFSTGIAFIMVCGFVGWLTYEAIASKDMNAMQMIPNIIFNFTTLFAIPGGILGIASHHRGKQKRLNSGENLIDRI